MKLYKADSIDIPMGPPGTTADFIDVEDVVGAVRRQGKLFAIVLLTSLCIGALYLTLAQPFYSSDVTVILDRDGDLPEERRSQSDIDWARLDPTRNDPYILTQIQLFRSNAVLDRVIDELGLLKDEEFQASNRSLATSVLNVRTSVLVWMGVVPETGVVDAAAEQRERARIGLLSGLDVTRIGETNGLRVRYVSTSPDLSARIVNAISDAYATDLLSARYDSTRLAGSWLQEKIAELRQKAIDSDMAVQSFRSEHNLLATTDQQTEEDVLLSSQQLEDLNKSLSSARADAAYTRAQYEQIKHIIDSGQIDAEISGTIRNYLSNELRQYYIEAVRLEADLSRRFGPNHAQAVRLRVTIDGYRALMFDELQRVAQSYLSEMQVAEARLKNIADRAQTSAAQATIAAEDQVQMREFERAAESYRRLYEAFLLSYQQSMQQQNVPVTRSRVVSSGRPADAPNYPSRSLIMALFFMIGMVGGGSLAAFREFRDRFFRTGAQVEDRLSLVYLGAVPLIESEAGVAADGASFRTEGERIANYVVDHPFSDFAETMRSAKIAIDVGLPVSTARVVGIVSTAPGEGKSTIAINLARLLADQGKRVMLIDADLRNPGATRALALEASSGVLEVLVHGQDWRQHAVNDTRTAMKFLPAVVRFRVSHSADLLSSARMKALIEELRPVAQYVIVDLPPLAPVVDARAIASLIDRFIYVVEWGGISQSAVTRAIEQAPVVIDKCVGVVLSKVDPRRSRLYKRSDI